MRRFVRENALTLFFLLIFLLALAGQAVTGMARLNHDLVAEGAAPVSLLAYVTSGDFAVDVAENWQSEYLQFFLFIVVTVWLVQKGSPESKQPGEEGAGSDKDAMVGAFARAGSPRWARAGGIRRWLLSNSLGLVMGVLFLLSWLGQSVAGLSAYNAEQLGAFEDPVTWAQYVGSAEFWNRTLQNWQSEFLAVASMVSLAVFLRQRGSPESKPVGAPHGATSVEN
ncbi:DUF6766 family protein [Bailinhaonella thermotolerans]|uniref:Uncharacterized protein n=1 Tax=Bailinhaonella thermotolerans TaxID=1070861 RepID=A0A3A4AT19_9ACTN|nr:DUF6766 family protein [Bailinhaonella thermotolerans]RJL31729.1 hypothetical protein D5H75_18690 [Bailinhaonella thermotolerans]